MRRALVVMTSLLILVVLVVRVWAAPPFKTLEGYWMGIDPVDGGDQRRSFVRQDDGTFRLTITSRVDRNEGVNNGRNNQPSSASAE